MNSPHQPKNTLINYTSFRYVCDILIMGSLLLAAPGFAKEIGLPRQSTVHGELVDKQLKRVSENGGQVIVDGSLRVNEPIYTEILDLVEVSTSVAAAPNHVRLFAVAVGTYTVIKAQFDNGTVITLGNN